MSGPLLCRLWRRPERRDESRELSTLFETRPPDCILSRDTHVTYNRVLLGRVSGLCARSSCCRSHAGFKASTGSGLPQRTESKGHKRTRAMSEQSHDQNQKSCDFCLCPVSSSHQRRASSGMYIYKSVSFLTPSEQVIPRGPISLGQSGGVEHCRRVSKGLNFESRRELTCHHEQVCVRDGV